MGELCHVDTQDGDLSLHTSTHYLRVNIMTRAEKEKPKHLNLRGISRRATCRTPRTTVLLKEPEMICRVPSRLYTSKQVHNKTDNKEERSKYEKEIGGMKF